MLHLNLSAETAILRDALLAAPIGDVVTFDELAEAIGRNVRTAARGKLESARRVCERDHNAVFETVRGVGLRRIPATEAAGLGAGARKSITRTAKRGLRRMEACTAGANSLPPSVQVAVAREASALGLMAHLAQDDAVKAMTDTDKAPPPAHAAEAFLSHIGAVRRPADA